MQAPSAAQESTLAVTPDPTAKESQGAAESEDSKVVPKNVAREQLVEGRSYLEHRAQHRARSSSPLEA